MSIALVTQMLGAIAQYWGESLGWTATNELRADLALHCLRLDLGFHKKRTGGELIERIDGDVTALAGFFSRFVVNVIGSIALLVGVCIVVLREDVRAGLALCGFAGLAAFVLLGPLRTIAVLQWRRVRESSAQLFGSIGEHLSGTEDIRSSGAEHFVMYRLALGHRDMLGARRTAMISTSFIWSGSILTFAIGSAVAFGVGGFLWTIGAATVGTVYLLFYYTELLRRPIEQLRRELEEMQRAFASVGRVDELLRARSALPDGSTGTLPSGPLSVDLERVSFEYDPGETVLREVDLHLSAGRVLGLLGRTGSGKTTLARLLLRFYDATDGAARLGGIDVRDTTLANLRARATLVTQDVQLFHASMRDNVTFFDRTVSDDAIKRVLERMGLGAWLVRRGGLDAELIASEVSAGEAQLLAFARVFLRDVGLVILDEASSRLDPATERQVERAIDALLHGRTAVVIAHRLETLARCDEIVILENGRVVETGDRVALAADPRSRFAELLHGGAPEVLA